MAMRHLEETRCQKPTFQRQAGTQAEVAVAVAAAVVVVFVAAVG